MSTTLTRKAYISLTPQLPTILQKGPLPLHLYRLFSTVFQHLFIKMALTHTHKRMHTLTHAHTQTYTSLQAPTLYMCTPEQILTQKPFRPTKFH